MSPVASQLVVAVVVIFSKPFPTTASVISILDTKEDFLSHPPVARLRRASYFPRYFEYYENTSEFEDQANNTESCAHHLQRIPEVNGIWAACRSPMNTGECENISHVPCNPFIYIYFGAFKMRTVRITAILNMYGILRISKDEQCSDYGWVRDPNSTCEFKEVPSNYGEGRSGADWSSILFSLPNGDTFSDFEIRLVARFEDDVILIDKIEASDNLFCEWDEPCSTEFPLTTTATTGSPQIENSILDTKGEVGGEWNIAQEFKRYMEYYENTSELRNNSENPDSCAHYMSQGSLNRLGEAEGVWVACQDPELPPECSAIPSSPCNSFIKFLGYSSHYCSIKVSFSIEGSAILRLTFPGALDPWFGPWFCLDVSLRKEPFSSCRFVQVHDSHLGSGWSHIIFNADSMRFNWFHNVRLDLITRFQHDVILVDKVEVTPLLGYTCLNPTTLITTTKRTGSSPITITSPTTLSTVETETQFTGECSSSHISDVTSTPGLTSTTQTEDATTSTIKTTETTETETTQIITVTTSEPRTTTVTVTTTRSPLTTPEVSTTETKSTSTTTTAKTTTTASPSTITSTASSSSTTEERMTSEDIDDRSTTDSGAASRNIFIGNVISFIIVAKCLHLFCVHSYLI